MQSRSKRNKKYLQFWESNIVFNKTYIEKCEERVKKKYVFMRK